MTAVPLGATSAASRAHPETSVTGSVCLSASDRVSAGVGPAPSSALSKSARTSPGLPPNDL